MQVVEEFLVSLKAACATELAVPSSSIVVDGFACEGLQYAIPYSVNPGAPAVPVQASQNQRHLLDDPGLVTSNRPWTDFQSAIIFGVMLAEGNPSKSNAKGQHNFQEAAAKVSSSSASMGLPDLVGELSKHLLKLYHENCFLHGHMCCILKWAQPDPIASFSVLEHGLKP